jgi:hypothetical protein
MSWTKRELVLQAFAEIGLAAYVYDLQPEQLQTALNRLDSMVATWNADGLRLGYTMASPSTTDLDQDSGLPDAANEAVYLNLAIRLASSVGKVVSEDLTKPAREAYTALSGKFVQVPERLRPSDVPAGAGNKPWRVVGDPFLPSSPDPVTTGLDGNVDLY